MPLFLTNRCKIRKAAFDGAIHWGSSLGDKVLIDRVEDAEREEFKSLEVRARRALSHVPFGMALYGLCKGINLMLRPSPLIEELPIIFEPLEKSPE